MNRYTAEQQARLAAMRVEFDAMNAELEANQQAPPGMRLVGTPGGDWRTPQAQVVRLVPTGEIITQYGTSWFRAAPEFHAPVVQIEVSMIRGKRSVEFAAQKVLRRPKPKPDSRVRYFRTDDLWLN